MASRYYNPRLASSLGAAESNIPINAAGAFERGFMPVFQRGVQIKQKEEQARLAALEKIAERKRKLREDVANEYKDFVYKVQETIPPNQIDLTNQMMQLGKRVFQIAATIEDPMERAEYQMTAIRPIGEISKFWNNEKEISESAAAIIENNMMSKANQFDSDGYEIAMKRYKGDYKQFFDEDLGEFVCEFDIDGEKVSILSEDLQKYNVLPKASEAIKNNNDNELAFIKYVETQKIFPDHPAFNDILNSYLDKFEINTPGEAISILVDHFKIAGRKDAELQQNLKKLEAVLDPYSKSGIRKNEEDNFIYEDIDEQGNKTNEILTGEEAIIEMAKDQYAKVMRSAATNLGIYYNDKDEPESKLTESDRKRQRNKDITNQTMASIISDPIKAIEKSGMPDKTEVKNNKINFYEIDEKNNKIINAQFDLKTKEGIIALAKHIASYDYKNDVDLIYNINNYPLTDEQLNEIQKAFLPNILPIY